MGLYSKNSSGTSAISYPCRVRIYYSEKYNELKIPVNDFQRALCVIQCMGNTGVDTSIVMFSLSRDYSNTQVKTRIISNPSNLTLDCRLDTAFGGEEYFIIAVSYNEMVLKYFELLTIDMSIDEQTIYCGTDGSEFP